MTLPGSGLPVCREQAFGGGDTEVVKLSRANQGGVQAKQGEDVVKRGAMRLASTSAPGDCSM